MKPVKPIWVSLHGANLWLAKGDTCKAPIWDHYFVKTWCGSGVIATWLTKWKPNRAHVRRLCVKRGPDPPPPPKKNTTQGKKRTKLQFEPSNNVPAKNIALCIQIDGPQVARARSLAPCCTCQQPRTCTRPAPAWHAPSALAPS